MGISRVDLVINEIRRIIDDGGNLFEENIDS